MKNIVALGICLAAFTAYAQETEEKMMTQEVSELTANVQTREALVEEVAVEEVIEIVQADMAEDVIAEDTRECTQALPEEYATDAQETFTVTMKQADGSEVSVQAEIITLAQTKELFATQEAVEFFATKGITSAEAFDSIVALLTQIQNKSIEIEGVTVPLDGISLFMNDHNYFIKASEFLTLNNDDVVADEADQDTITDEVEASQVEEADTNN